jgi:hypothetical protein
VTRIEAAAILLGGDQFILQGLCDGLAVHLISIGMHGRWKGREQGELAFNSVHTYGSSWR